MSSIAQNITHFLEMIPKEVTLVAVSKTHPVNAIQQAYDAGHRIFGENKVQEMTQKYEQLPKDIQWHMIGHLQRNKIKYIAPYVDLIHGVDDRKKLIEINKQAVKNNRIISCLLQIKIAQEDTKFGLSIKEAEDTIKCEEIKMLNNICIKGFMGMASFTKNIAQIKEEFSTLEQFYEKTQALATHNFSPTILSMGMSGDYQIAIKNGSTMIRIGSAIFGNRNYQ